MFRLLLAVQTKVTSLLSAACVQHGRIPPAVCWDGAPALSGDPFPAVVDRRGTDGTDGDAAIRPGKVRVPHETWLELLIIQFLPLQPHVFCHQRLYPRRFYFYWVSHMYCYGSQVHSRAAGGAGEQRVFDWREHALPRDEGASGKRTAGHETVSVTL